MRNSGGWIGTLIAAGLWVGLAANAEEAKRVPAFGPMKYRVADMDKSVDFYKRVLGMQEVFRVVNQYPPGNTNQLVEVGLKFGATVDEAKADKGNTLILMNCEKSQKTYKAPDDLPNFIITVADVDAIAKRTRDNGFAVYVAPYEASPTTRALFIKDPSGNIVELLQPK